MITVTEQVHRPPGIVNSKPISLEAFRQKYLEKKTYKYEWNPQIKQVWIHTSPASVIVCPEGSVCSADPVVPGFHISVGEIFG